MPQPKPTLFYKKAQYNGLVLSLIEVKKGYGNEV